MISRSEDPTQFYDSLTGELQYWKSWWDLRGRENTVGGGAQAGTDTTQPGLGGHVVVSLPLKQQISQTSFGDRNELFRMIYSYK